MEPFAKLYNDTRYGQIVVILQRGGETCNPEIRLYFQPEGLGVCSFSVGYADTDNGWDSAQKEFAEFSQEKAEGNVGLWNSALLKHGVRSDSEDQT